MKPQIIAGVGITHLRIYEDRPAIDGMMSGCAHVHAITDEAYYVLSGEGFVDLHDPEHGFRRIPLRQGTFVQFSPGVLHRAVSTDRLEVLAIIGNAGLAEHGDARIYFGLQVDEEAEEYERLSSLPRREGLEGALKRRDASIAAYQDLMRLWDTDREAYRNELTRFIRQHQRGVEARRCEFEQIIEQGPIAWGHASLERIRKLATALEPAQSFATHPDRSEPALGMCGYLRPLSTLDPV